jgi:hypothetical protein
MPQPLSDEVVHMKKVHKNLNIKSAGPSSKTVAQPNQETPRISKKVCKKSCIPEQETMYIALEVQDNNGDCMAFVPLRLKDSCKKNFEKLRQAMVVVNSCLAEQFEVWRA